MRRRIEFVSRTVKEDKACPHGSDPLVRQVVDLAEQAACAITDLTIFDAKALDAVFVADSGDERLAEHEATGELIRLPYERCLFEFHDLGVIAEEILFFEGGDESARRRGIRYPSLPSGGSDTGPGMQFYVVPYWDIQPESLLWFAYPGHLFQRDTLARIRESNTLAGLRESEPNKFAEMNRDGPLYYVGGPTPAQKQQLARAVRLALGVVTLLDERLLKSEEQPAPRFINRQRAAKGKHPLEPYHVLTLNLAETRRRTAGIALGSHESPRLHWRRGHWRQLAPERRVWVRKCLVGDPDKGFVAKHYALTL